MKDSDESPEIVPEKIENPFNYKALLGIAILVISFHIGINYFIETDDADTIVSIFSMFVPLTLAIIGFSVVRKYKGTQVFGKAYLALSFGYLSIFFAEVTYAIYDIVYNIEPYPSIADIFFFMLYPLLLAYLFINIKFFSPNLGKKAKVWIIVMPLIVLLAYSVVSTTAGEISILEFDFYYGIIFVYAATLTLAVSIVGASIFKQGVIGKAWLILVIGILLNNLGDLWYYNLELFGEYDLLHPVNMFWYSGYIVVIYALVIHKKTL
ncbi:MAG: histidine kinase [Candidatus Nitrosomaritimum yanchengensis]